MIFTYLNRVRLRSDWNRESLITIEAANQLEADNKFYRLVRYGREIGFYV